MIRPATLEFSEVYTADFPTSDEAYRCELLYYRKVWCSCGAYILISKTDPKPLYKCRCGKLFENKLRRKC